MWPEPATPRLGRLGSGHRVRPGTERSPREERAPLGVPRRLANALPLSIFVQRPRFLAKFFHTKTNTWEQPPTRGEELISARQMFQQLTN